MPGGWELAASAAKLAIHAGLACACGAVLLLLLLPERTGARRAFVAYGVVGAVAGGLGAALYFMVQLGTVVGRGPAGMLDSPMAAVLWSTSLGTSLAFRLWGFLLAILALTAYGYFDRIDDGPAHPRRLALGLVGLAGALLVGAGSAVAGHTAVVGPATQFALLVHGVAAAAWIGALAPLLCLAFRDPPAVLSRTLRCFGDVARWGVLALLAAGAWMTFRLVDLPAGLWTSTWGLLLVAKVALTGALVVLAALNRRRWVPALALESEGSSGGTTPGPEVPGSGSMGEPVAAVLPLRRSILAELCIVVAVLLLTGQLSTVYGPDGH